MTRLRPVTSSLGPLILISDVGRTGEERFLATLRAAVLGGLRSVQIREKDRSDEELKHLVRAVRERCGSELAVMINGRPELVLELGLSGVHIGGGRPDDVARARELVGAERLVGYSAHELDELPLLECRGADYVFFSPVFPPLSKSGSLPPIGLEGLRRATASTSLPVYALGGVTAVHAGELRRAGASGAAVIGALTDVPDPTAATCSFLAAWRGEGGPDEEPGEQSTGV